MSRRRGVLLLAGLLVLSTIAAIPGVVSAQTADSGQVIGRPDLSFATSTGELAPGVSTEASIAVTNRGRLDRAGPERHENRVTTARGLTLKVQDDDVPFKVSAGTVSVGNVPVGTAPTDPIPLQVSEDAEPGTYRVPVEYEYQYTRIASYGPSGAEYRDMTRSDTGELVIEVRDGPVFDVTETTSNAQVGDTGDVSVTMTNVGTESATDASVSVASGSPALTFDSGESQATASVDSWAPGETRTLTYSVSVASGAPGRTYSTNLGVAYTNEKGIQQPAAPRSLNIPVADEQNFAVSNVSADLRVGEEGTITGRVTNTGAQTAHSAVVRFADDSPTLVPVEETTAVGTLDAGASADFSLPVEVVEEARAGSKAVALSVRYRNADGERRTYDEVDAIAAVAPERTQFDVSIGNGTVEAGGERTVTVEATNNMDETVTDVQARLLAKDPLDAGDNNEGFATSVGPDETVTFTYRLSAASSATVGQTYPVSMDFRYDDARGNSQLSNTVRIPIDVSESEGGGLPLGTIGLVVLALGGLAAVVRYRRG